MYMSFHLTPSEEVTGGVWYTDQEFDTAFVNILLDHIYNYIAQRVNSMPLSLNLVHELTNSLQSLPPPTASCSRPLYPRSEIVRFPDTRRITDWVKKSGISEVELRESDIESLLRVLEFDGRIERIPSSLSLIEMSSDEEDGRATKGKSKAPLKRKRDVKGPNDNDPSNKWSKKAKREEYETDDDDLASKGRRNGRKDESDTDTDDLRSGMKGKKAAKRGRYSDTDDDHAGARGRAGHPKARSHGGYDTEEVSDDDRPGHQRYLKDASFVYRAIRPPTEDGLGDAEFEGHGTSSGFSMFSGSLFGGSWVGGQGRLPWAEAPCVQCPQVDFCQETGPVNASSCHYYDQWLDPERVVQKKKNRASDVQEDNEAALAIEVESS
jgi:DNA-directed RNA polymerase III subunit RPC6